MDFLRAPPSIGSVIKGGAPVTSMSYHRDGTHLFVTSQEDSKLRLVDCLKGTSDKPAIQCIREGVRLVEPTHHNQCVLFTGKGSKTQPLIQRNAIHYLSLYDNKILRNFKGHAGEITDLNMSPVDDTFLSSSTDRTVRLWNVQQAGCLAEMELPSTVDGAPHACFDSTGLVFGITAPMAAGSGHFIHLYDARNYSGGAFAELKLQQSNIEKAIHSKGVAPELAMVLSRSEWTSIKFDKSGKQLLVTGKKGLVMTLDGFDGTITNVFSNPSSTNGELSACFTPDDRTILTGNEDGSIHCWNAKNGNLLRKLEGHTNRVGCVAANPKYAQVASACSNTALWNW